jgi:hypothetical protein
VRLCPVLLLSVVFSCASLAAQSAPSQSGSASSSAKPASVEAAKPTASAVSSNANLMVIPAGTQVPVALKHGISTKTAKEGDPVYAETTFPVVLNEHILIPAGTYVQGKVTRVQRAGHMKGRAQLLMHFTTLIYPTGYTVVLPGSIENVPGADKTNMKDKEGTIEENGQTGEKVTKAAEAGTEGATGGAVIGGLSQGAKGAGIGAGVGGAAGAMIALFSRGSDVKLDPGMTVQMEIQRDVPIDPSRILVAGK